MGDTQLESEANELEEIEDKYKILIVPAIEFYNDPERQPIILANFLRRQRYGNSYFKLIHKDHYFTIYERFIKLLLQRPDSMIRYAVLKNGTILGWCLYEKKTVHFVWVKKEACRKGIGSALLPKEFDSFSHITNKILSSWNSRFPNARFTPFI